MFDYTTRDGILRVYEAMNGFYISLRNGEEKGMGDGVDSLLQGLINADYDDPEENTAQLNNYRKMYPEQIMVTIEADEWELIESYFGYEKGDEAVMTDEELEAQYRHEICAWDWDYLKNQAIQNYQEDEEGDPRGFTWVGSYYALTPSGKVYAFWTSNQTGWDELRDEIWWEVLEKVASEHGMWQTEGGESDHLYLGCDLPEGFLEARQKEQEEWEADDNVQATDTE